jgi:hypothetical protein
VDSRGREAPALAEGMRAGRTRGGGSGFGRGRDTSTFTRTSDAVDDGIPFTGHCCRGFLAKKSLKVEFRTIYKDVCC